jgi:hypothetical protein
MHQIMMHRDGVRVGGAAGPGPGVDVGNIIQTYDDPENGNYMYYINYVHCFELNELHTLY